MKPNRKNHPTDCGNGFNHAPHLYRTERGKVKACDGDTSKRGQVVRG